MFQIEIPIQEFTNSCSAHTKFKEIIIKVVNNTQYWWWNGKTNKEPFQSKNHSEESNPEEISLKDIVTISHTVQNLSNLDSLRKPSKHPVYLSTIVVLKPLKLFYTNFLHEWTSFATQYPINQQWLKTQKFSTLFVASFFT